MALERIPELKPDILLLDVRMPELDGISVLEKIKGLMPHLKIIMLTTFQDVERAKTALSKGASGFLLKNMSVDDLIEKDTDNLERRCGNLIPDRR